MSVLRADRLAAICFFHPLRRLQPRASRVPILMYHSISETRSDFRHPYFWTATSPRVFESHLRFLSENRYQGVNLTDGVAATACPKKSVIITFDDGFKDFYTHAFPLLRQYEYSATVFLPTAYIGDSSARRFRDIECMTWSQIRELQTAGVQFGSHTVSHPQLRTLKADNIRDEVRRSKETIEGKLGAPVKSFSYPYAFPEADRHFKERLRTTLHEAGYQNAVCTSIGAADPRDERFFLKRLPMNSGDDPRLFKAKLEGGYDWLGALQYVSKLRPGRSRWA